MGGLLESQYWRLTATQERHHHQLHTQVLYPFIVSECWDYIFYSNILLVVINFWVLDKYEIKHPDSQTNVQAKNHTYGWVDLRNYIFE